MQTNSRQLFEQEAERWRSELALTRKKLDAIAWLRLLIFVLTVVLFLLAGNLEINGARAAAIILGLAAFAFAVKRNQKLKKREALELALIGLNEAEIRRLDGEIHEFEDGAEFSDREHPYSSDLDLFGRHSLWQLANRAVTPYGRRAFAAVLLRNVSAARIASRQEAVAELSSRLEWRQMLQALGLQVGKDTESPEAFSAWLHEKPVYSTSPLYTVIGILGPILVCTAVTLGFMGILPVAAILGAPAIAAIVNHRIAPEGMALYGQADNRSRLMRAYAGMIEQAEGLDSQSKLLTDLHSRLHSGPNGASSEIHKLVGIIQALELRLNGMGWFIMNNFFFWDLHYLRALERWKTRNSEHAIDWLHALGELEAMSSLAALRCAYPDWVFPEIREEGYTVEGKELGHPLIPSGQRVENPITITDRGRVWLITGSNMAGKSTYLRTVGINAVLALSGVPVCASSFSISPLQVLTSMRTLDNLEENASSFYAELERLSMVIRVVEEGEPVLFLLDEILKGTNSRDRHAGARALIRQLVEAGGSGLVSTHDLELAQMEEKVPEAVRNYSFHCEVTDSNELNFDYRLHEGVCPSMNASALMRNMGIRGLDTTPDQGA